MVSANLIDHTLLKNTSSLEDFENLALEAKKYGFFSVCVPPSQVSYCKDKLTDTGVKTISVAGFPLGYSSLAQKQYEISTLFESGCDEVDVVLNVGAVRQKNWDLVKKEFQIFSEISKTQILKVIIESGILEKEEIQNICNIASDNKVSFIKTSTGFAKVGAKVEDVKLLRSLLPNEIHIKASGGIKTTAQALSFLAAGANRLGCSSSVQILKGKN